MTRVSMKIKSKYSTLGGFGYLLFLVILSGFILPYMFPRININPFSMESWHNEYTRIVMFFSLGFQALLVLFFISQCKYIISDHNGITFVNPIFPFIRKTRKWSDYDYYQTNQEATNGGSYEAIWLIKDDLLIDRISSFYYSNYGDIKDGIKAKNNGFLDISLTRQFFCLFGLKIK